MPDEATLSVMPEYQETLPPTTLFTMNAARALFVTWNPCLLVGSTSIPWPPRLKEGKSNRLPELPLPYSSGVAPYIHPVFPDSLKAALR